MKLIDEEYMQQMAKNVCNWGRWGEEDEIGCLNYVTADCVQAAAALVRTGKVIQLGMNLDKKGPQTAGDCSCADTRFNPIHTMTWTGVEAMSGRELFHHPAPKGHRIGRPWFSTNFADDNISMPLQAATHWDALAHIFYRDMETGEFFMWNGRSAANVDIAGCHKSGVDKYGTKLIGRGVLLDMAAYKGVDYLEPGMGISAEDLESCAMAEGVEIRKGDFLLLRTGDADRRIREGCWGNYNDAHAGLEFETLPYLYEKQVAAVAADNHGVEVRPHRSEIFDNPFHWVALPMMGLPLGENFCLDVLAEDCKADGRYVFLFVSPPLLVTGATGTPLNPYAVK